MRRSWKAVTLAAAILLLLGTLATVSIASAAPQTAEHPKTQVLHFIGHQTSLELIDLGKKGDSPGDQAVETETLLQNGTRIGRDVLSCVAITVSAQGIDALCHGALILRGGQIQFQGETTFATPFTVAVTGGTGRYQNVGGQLTVERTLPNGVDDVETLRLVFFETE
jgi:hypothetical protein